MVRRLFVLILLCWLIWLPPRCTQAALFGPVNKTQFVPAAQAFPFNFQQKNPVLILEWQTRPGYYLYRHTITLTPKNATLDTYTLPKGVAHHDEFFGDVEIYPEPLTLSIPLLNAKENASVTITYQGCAKTGFCYPPESVEVPLNPVSAVHASGAGSVSQNQPNNATPVLQSAPPDSKAIPFSVLGALFSGILIAFTPCVLPMYPLISALILGRKEALSRRRILLLAFSYVQGMALTYTLLGMVVAFLGLQFQAALQHPYILIGLSLLFILLALSMFGVYSLQLPSGMQTRLTEWSNKQQGGSLTGVFVMGALAGLICSPCTTAPLSAILLYIAQSGNLVTGGITLYAYALGMGIPLIIVAVFGNQLLPRSGPWMQYFKEGFGFVILALPVFLLERIIGDEWGLRLWSLLFLSFFCWAFILSLRLQQHWGRILQIVLLGCAIISSQPLQNWVFGDTPSAVHNSLPFRAVDSVATLENELESAKGKVVMLDFYADWCVACKEFEKYTFRDAQVQRAMADMVLLQANTTENNQQYTELYRYLNILGLPTIVFFDSHGNELTDMRITGFIDGPEFTRHITLIKAQSETNTASANKY